jgi:four helix bundle protein
VDANELKKRTKEFAHSCVKLAMTMPEIFLCEHIRRQLIRCATSVAANYRAACVAQSRASFATKISIAAEEADESCFWLEFIIEEGILKSDSVESLLKEGQELTSIFIVSRKTVKNRSDEFYVADRVDTSQ